MVRLNLTAIVKLAVICSINLKMLQRSKPNLRFDLFYFLVLSYKLLTFRIIRFYIASFFHSKIGFVTPLPQLASILKAKL